MIDEQFSVLHPFIISWNLRNIFSDPSTLTPDQLAIKGTCLGEYPINGWGTYFLETPKNGHKKDITGRFNSASGIGIEKTKWNRTRTINLPIYSHVQDHDLEKLKIIIKHWYDIGIPDDVPCLAIAIKCSGLDSDYREVQYVAVLTIWNDVVARIISLDWFEGPLEDCITPEWYMETTPLLNLKDAIKRMRNIYKNTHWNNPSFSIYTIPACLGSCLNGEVSNDSYNLWDKGWGYSDYPKLKSDINVLLSKISDIFSFSPESIGE